MEDNLFNISLALSVEDLYVLLSKFIQDNDITKAQIYLPHFKYLANQNSVYTEFLDKNKESIIEAEKMISQIAIVRNCIYRKLAPLINIDEATNMKVVSYIENFILNIVICLSDNNNTNHLFVETQVIGQQLKKLYFDYLSKDYCPIYNFYRKNKFNLHAYASHDILKLYKFIFSIILTFDNDLLRELFELHADDYYELDKKPLIYFYKINENNIIKFKQTLGINGTRQTDEKLKKGRKFHEFTLECKDGRYIFSPIRELKIEKDEVSAVIDNWNQIEAGMGKKLLNKKQKKIAAKISAREGSLKQLQMSKRAGYAQAMAQNMEKTGNTSAISSLIKNSGN